MVTSSEQITSSFITQIQAGLIHPRHMADLLYAMNHALVDRFEAVNLWLPRNLEEVADSVIEAIESADTHEQDNPEEEEATV